MTKSRSQRRVVTFSNDIETTIGKSDHSLTVEHSKLWYSVNDIEQLKNNYQNLILIHKTRYKLSQQARCSAEITGLEKYLSAELSEEFKQSKEELYRAIQSECLLSTMNGGLPDIDKLASVSRFHTEWAMTQATFAAQLLQKDVSRASAAAATSMKSSRSRRMKKHCSSISSKSTASTTVITEDTRTRRSTRSECKAVECQTIGDIKCSSSQAALALAA